MATRSKKHVKKDPSYRDLKADYYPVQRTIAIASNGSVVGSNQLVDVGRFLSNTNHRLYRQGKTYQCKVDLDNNAANVPGLYTVWALMDTWFVQKAWQLARATYDKSMSDERHQIGESMVARWEDFRVNSGLTGVHNCVPYKYGAALTGAIDTNGEIQSSRITLSDGSTQRTFSWGATGGSDLGMLEEYDKVNNTHTALPTSALAYAGVDDETQEAAADDLKGRGNLPPYHENNFNSSIWVKIAVLDNSAPGASAGRLTTGFFNAPCGLVAITTPSANQTLVGQLSLTVKAGKYKGVAAMNMGA